MAEVPLRQISSANGRIRLYAATVKDSPTGLAHIWSDRQRPMAIGTWRLEIVIRDAIATGDQLCLGIWVRGAGTVWVDGVELLAE